VLRMSDAGLFLELPRGTSGGQGGTDTSLNNTPSAYQNISCSIQFSSIIKNDF
jgi:hypothetical protein